MRKKNLLNISDLERKDVLDILKYSEDLKNSKSNILDNKSIGLIFEKYSTRTRLSFQVGIKQLGGNSIDIRFEELNLQRVETFEDTFKIFGCYLDAIVYRTSKHENLIKASQNFVKPIINALSDLSHPCQIISDIYTIKNHFNSLDGLSISWFGDINNVLFSYFEILRLFPEISLNVFTDKKIYNDNSQNFPKTSNINIYFDINESLIKNTDCIMTDVFTSMNDLSDKKQSSLQKFQINKKILDLTKDECIFMHCLPANKGQEVTEDVLVDQKSIILEQAKNRLVAQKGILQWLDI
tara:strand:+ start:2002 stop:2889 length:888 start_codon:yes stop_codon:yes gene_type:complete